MRSGLGAKCNTLQPFKETRQKLHKSSCFNFPSGFDVLLFDFLSAWFFDRTYLLNSWKHWPYLDHNPRKIPVEDSWIIILQNNSKCLLLNDKQMPHEILFSLLDEIQNTKKMKTRESKERKFEKKVREIGWVVLIFI